jgi:flagellar hook capping protein FlgD
MDIVGDVVYGVGDDCKLYGYNLDTEQQVLDVSFPTGAGVYLSSVTSDSTGHLFISCPALHTIYKFRLSDESYWIFAEGNGLNRPNGILLESENNRIVVIDDSPSTSIIHAISLSDSTVTDLMTNNFDRPDGIVRDVVGTYYVGGYYLPGLYRFDEDFSQPPEMFFAGSHMVYPTYDPSDHSLLVTYYGDHSWGRVMIPAGILAGTVTANPQANLEEIEIEVCNLTVNPDETGMFTRNVPAGIFDVTASLEGYESVTIEDVEFNEGQVTPLFFELNSVHTSEYMVSHLNVLHQNSPNPFNPETKISFDLKSDSNVILEIYNMKGQIVRSLINEPLSAGNHFMVWNGQDDNNKKVSSGIYFYKIKTPDFQATRKMLLMK